MGLQILLATTGSRIIGLDTDAPKLAFAESKGAIAIPSDGEAAGKILELTNGIGADVVFDFVGVQPTVNTALAPYATAERSGSSASAAAFVPLSRRLRSEPSVGREHRARLRRHAVGDAAGDRPGPRRQDRRRGQALLTRRRGAGLRRSTSRSRPRPGGLGSRRSRYDRSSLAITRPPLEPRSTDCWA